MLCVMTRRIVLFGGSFDPIHVGHTTVARAANDLLHAERLIFIPARRSPHKDREPVADGSDRLAMIRLAIADHPRLDVSDCELRRAGPSYTLDTVRAFRQMYGDAVELCWLVGADAARDLHRWHRAAELLDACRVCVMRRGGAPVPDWSPVARALGRERADALAANVIETPLVDVSSSAIREDLARGKDVSDRLAPAVWNYIRRRGLYRAQNAAGPGVFD